MRYCGNCGTSLSPEMLATGRADGSYLCPSCGAPINQTGDIASSNAMDASQEPTREPLLAFDNEYSATLVTDPALDVSATQATSTVSRRVTIRPFTLAALAVVALLLALGSALLPNNAPAQLRASLPFSGSGSRESSPQTSAGLPTTPGAHSSPTNNAQSAPLASPATSPVPGTPTAGTVTPGAATTPTATASQPTLAIAPLQIALGVCVSASTQFTVTNTGDGTLAWSASASQSLYTLSPQGGFLDHGQQQIVKVSGVNLSGTITVSASGATNSPQTVTITCKL